MENNLVMNELQEEPNTLKHTQNPKVILGFLFVVVIGVAILLGVIYSDDGTILKDSTAEEIVVEQKPANQGEERPFEEEIEKPADVPLRETGVVEILGEPVPADTEIGYLAPSFKAQLNNGSELLTVNPADGTVRLIGFFAHWCPHCQREVPRVSKWLEENGVPTQIEILAVSTAVREGTPNYPPSEWFTLERWPTDIFVDNEESDLATAYGLAGFPYWVVIDASGVVVHRSSGELTEEQFGYLVDLAISLTPQIT